jgi:hypothetical protein
MPPERLCQSRVHRRTCCTRRLSLCLTVVLLALPLHGCQLIAALSPAKREAQRQTQVRRDLQLQVMRVADEYVGQPELEAPAGHGCLYRGQRPQPDH